MTRKSRGEKVNKGLCCAMFGWTRYKFDQNIAKGMPHVRAAAHKGDEWVVNTAEVAAWIEEEKRRRREYVRRREERTRAMFRAMEERQEAVRRAERERVARWEAESRASRGGPPARPCLPGLHGPGPGRLRLPAGPPPGARRAPRVRTRLAPVPAGLVATVAGAARGYPGRAHLQALRLPGAGLAALVAGPLRAGPTVAGAGRRPPAAEEARLGVWLRNVIGIRRVGRSGRTPGASTASGRR